MFQDLQLACVVIFTVSIPLLVLARYRYAEIPTARLLLVLATVLGWGLANAHAGLEHLWVDAERREEWAAFDQAIRHPPPPVELPDGSIEIGNPGIAEYLWEEYHPVTAIIYGPAYLGSCWLAAWAIFRRSSPGVRRPILLVSAGMLLAVWAAIIGELIKIKPPGIFSDGVFIYGWNPFFGPQLALPLAGLTTWLVVAWLPTALATALERSIKGA